MAKVTEFPSFITSYRFLEKNKDKETLVEFYHNDTPSEPSISVVDHVDSVLAAKIDGSAYIGIRFDGGTDLSFNDKNYNTNISNGAVIFSSKYDDETYCIIAFVERGVI